MVNETINADNQLTVNSSSSPRTKTSKLIQRNKHIQCNNNSRSQANPISPITMNKRFTVFHQNIRGVRDKTGELLGSL